MLCSSYLLLPDVYWFKEGDNDTDAIETNDKYEVTTDDSRHTLEIFFTTPEDSGQYLCLAKNDVTSSHWLFGLTVEGMASNIRCRFCYNVFTLYFK